MSNVKIEHVTFYKVGHRSFETLQDAEAHLQFEQLRSEIDELKSLIAGSLENALKVAQAIIDFVKQVRESENVTGS